MTIDHATGPQKAMTTWKYSHHQQSPVRAFEKVYSFAQNNADPAQSDIHIAYGEERMRPTMQVEPYTISPQIEKSCS